jgi:hypothetical protein
MVSSAFPGADDAIGACLEVFTMNLGDGLRRVKEELG